MNKLVDWGRWLVASFFAFQALLVLTGVEMAVIFLAVIGEGMYPYTAIVGLVAGLAMLACAWGLIKMRRWAYATAFVISLLESFLAAIGVGQPRVKFSGTWYWIGDVGFGLNPAEILSLLFAVVVLGWLALPPIRRRYWQRVAAA
jgi:hypothetical protein